MKTKRIMVRLVKATFILSVLLVAVLGSELALAASASPFIGHWQAIDLDGSDIRLIIAGPPNGPFRITWTESYISFCEGEAGIVQGIGTLNEGDPYLLEADLHVECFTTGASMDLHLTFRYHPLTDNLSTRYDNGFVTIFSRPGRVTPPPPALGLRVNYGEGGWVESFYEADHTVWIAVTESDGLTVKATAQVNTEPRSEWDGEEGFQTTSTDWDPEEPDIQPYDWVYAWVDNGASAQVQIGEISGIVDLEGDLVEGTVNAPWFDTEADIDIECHSWGKPGDEILKYDVVKPDGLDSYTCSWSEWEIQPGQSVGVAYFGPDGHWVANVFYNNARIVASESGNWFWVGEFVPLTTLSIKIYSSNNEEAVELYSGSLETDESGFAWLGFDDNQVDIMMPGNYLVITDGITTKDLVLEPIAVTVFNTEDDVMAGTAPAGRWVWAAAGPQEYQVGIWVLSDPSAEEWTADFTTIGFDLTEEMRGWSYAQIFDNAGDINEGSTPPPNTWRDEFYGESIASIWSWENENQEKWNLTEQPGFLHLYAYTGSVGDQNLLLRPPADGNFMIETRLLFEPDTNFQFAGLVIFEDGGNFLQLGRAFCDLEDSCVGDGLYFDHLKGGEFFDGNFATGVESSSEVFLRLERLGDMIIGQYSLDGEDWFEIGVHWLPYGFQINGIGLSAHGDTNPEDEDIPADFDYFELTDNEDWWSPDARMVASITEDWFYLVDFAPYKTFVYDVYETQGGIHLWGGEETTDGSGFAWINADGRWDFEPGNYLIVSDGNTTKDLEVEGFTFDIFDTSNGVLLGTVPGQESRIVWVGIGFVDDGWSMEVLTDVNGNWVADFGASVPEFQWVAAQIFDGDGDASELRPAIVAPLVIISNQPDWVNTGITLSEGQSYSVEAFGLMNPCSDTYPNGPEFCIFYPPSGGDWVVPYDNIFGVFPGEGLHFMTLLGKVGDGEPFEIGEGGTFTAGQAGTLWLTPNDNLRTDNQGAYYVRVLLEP